MFLCIALFPRPRAIAPVRRRRETPFPFQWFNSLAANPHAAFRPLCYPLMSRGSEFSAAHSSRLRKVESGISESSAAFVFDQHVVLCPPAIGNFVNPALHKERVAHEIGFPSP